MGRDPMKIYGISQSTGVERRLYIEKRAGVLVLTISDHVGNVQREQIQIEADSILAPVMDRSSGQVTIEGVVPSDGPKRLLDLEVRRNEVLLKIRAESEDGTDIAVGL